MKIRTKVLALVVAAGGVGCATLTEDAKAPIAFAFSDGSSGTCRLMNKRGAWETAVPTTIEIRKSDDALTYACETAEGRTAFGAIPSEMGGKIVASAIFLDFGITDAITDKHRIYPASFVVPVLDAEPRAADTLTQPPPDCAATCNEGPNQPQG